MRKRKFNDIYKDLRSRIESGAYDSDKMLPSLPKLEVIYSTSRPTIRKALQKLEAETLITRQDGVGMVINSKQELQDTASKKFEIATEMELLESNYFNYSLPIMNGLKKAKKEYNFSLRIIDRNELVDFATQRTQNLPDGIILYTAQTDLKSMKIYKEIVEKGIPVILLNRIINTENIGMLAVDYRKEVCKAISCMLNNGASRIAVYRKTPENFGSVFSARIEGWRDAYRKANLKIPEELCISAKNYKEANLKLTELIQREEIDMIFITNGSCYYQVITTLAQNNIRVPEDISLLCFDDIGQLQDDIGIASSYLKMPLEEMSFEAAESIIEYKNKNCEQVPLQNIKEASLVIRGCKFIS